MRNYDYHPDLFEWPVISSAFTGRRVIGTSHCMWGLLDGMNDDGLIVPLTFGGRKGAAPGCAIPLVVRYLLEVAATLEEATVALAGIPVARPTPHHDRPVGRSSNRLRGNRDGARGVLGGFGTLHTTVYRPDQGMVEYRWPGPSFIWTFDSPGAPVPVLLHRRRLGADLSRVGDHTGVMELDGLSSRLMAGTGMQGGSDRVEGPQVSTR